MRASLLIVFLVVLAPSAAGAQSSSAQAEQLFRDGKAFMGEKQYAEACDAFAASQKLDPVVTTLANLADCREKNGQLASAWGHFLELERLTRDDKKQKALNASAKKRVAALEPRVSYLIINVPDESRVDGLEVIRNGEVVDSLTWNRALPIDGGEYVIQGKAPGHEAWSTTVTVATEGDKQSVDVPKFKELPAVAPDTVDPVVPPDADPVPGVHDGGGSSGMSGKRKLSLVVGGLGLVSLGVATYFELGARSIYRDAQREPNDTLQDELTAKANVKRGIAIGTGVLGVAAVGVAVYLWVTGDAEQSAPRAALVPMVTGDALGLAFVVQ